MSKQVIDDREAGMMTTTGEQGVGKTWENMHIIADIVKDKVGTGVRGRKCIIFDTNGEYTTEQFTKNGIPGFTAKTIALRDVIAWCHSPLVECRRIDAKSLSIKEKKQVIEYLLKNLRNCMLVMEDINNYILNVTHMEEVVGHIVNLRHKAVDVLLSYQSLRPVEPRIWQNSRWVRMHHQADNVMDIRGKVTDIPLFKIAQLIVNDKYDDSKDAAGNITKAGDKRFFVYIHVLNRKITGQFSKNDFLRAADRYLKIVKTDLKEEMDMHNLKPEEAIKRVSLRFLHQYYGN